MKKITIQPFLMFLLTGGCAALVNFGARLLFSQWWSYSISIVLAYLVGMVTAYVLAKGLVFTNSQQGLRKSIVYFCVVNLVAVAQTWLVSMVLARYLLPHWGITRHVEEVAHAVGIVVPVFSSYWGHKRFSFKSSASSDVNP